MVNVKHRRCQQPGCRRERLFTDDPNTKPLYCSLHLAYQERGIDPRMCDTDLPPGLTPISPPLRSGGGIGGMGAQVGSVPGGGMLPGLGGRRLAPEMQRRLPSTEAVSPVGRKRPRVGAGGEHGAEGAGEGDMAGMSAAQLQARMQQQQQQIQQLQEQQRRHHQQQAQHRRIYDLHPRGRQPVAPPSTAYLPPAPPVPGNAGYSDRGFGLGGGHSDVGGSFSGMPGYRSGSASMASSSGFVDAPIPGLSQRAAPFATVGGVGGQAGLGSGAGAGGVGGNGNGLGEGSSAHRASHAASSLPSTSLAWPGSGRGGSSVNTSVAAATSGASSVGSGVGASGDNGVVSGASGGGGGGVGASGEGGVGRGGVSEGDVKPPPTEPPVRGPLFQYTSRGMSAGHGPSGSIAPVRLPVLGWGPPPSTPPLLPGISNIRHLSAAAAVLAESSGAGSGAGTSSTQSRSSSSWPVQSYEPVSSSSASVSSSSSHQHRGGSGSVGPEQVGATAQGQQGRPQHQQHAGHGGSGRQGSSGAASTSPDQHLLGSAGWALAQAGHNFSAWGGSIEGLGAGGGGLDGGSAGGGSSGGATVHGPRSPHYWNPPHGGQQMRSTSHQQQQMMSMPEEHAPPGRLPTPGAMRAPGGAGSGGGGHSQLQ